VQVAARRAAVIGNHEGQRKLSARDCQPAPRVRIVPSVLGRQSQEIAQRVP